jgi:hypothetical protein
MGNDLSEVVQNARHLGIAEPGCTSAPPCYHRTTPTGASMPDAELEAMLARLFAPRAEITSQPDDPARLAAIYEEWRAF